MCRVLPCHVPSSYGLEQKFKLELYCPVMCRVLPCHVPSSYGLEQKFKLELYREFEDLTYKVCDAACCCATEWDGCT